MNEDGIGDNPYVIDAANQDNFPLMGTYYDFHITHKGEIYNVTVISNSTISELLFETGAETGNKIIHFDAIGKDGTIGFCRITIPIRFMYSPYIVLIDNEEISPTLLAVSNETHACLYFTYFHRNCTVTLISSEMLHLYYELLNNYLMLNVTYSDLLANFNSLLVNYTQLQERYLMLNMTYSDLLAGLNSLLVNYTQLQENYRELNNSYEEHLLAYSDDVQNMRNLVYIFVAATAIFIMSTIYLSKRAHESTRTRIKPSEEKE
jgi:hypothetical protein